MLNIVNKLNIKPFVKQPIYLKLKPMYKLESIHIFSMPTRIKDRDIKAMFNGLLGLLREKERQEQNEKYFQLQLKYNRLKQVYLNLKKISHNKIIK